MDDEVGLVLEELYPGATLTGRVVNHSAFEKWQDKAGCSTVPVYYEVRLQNGILKMVKVYKSYVIETQKEFSWVESFAESLAKHKQDDLILKYECIYHKEEEGLHFIGTEHFESTLEEYVRKKKTLDEQEALSIFSNLLAVVDALKMGPYLHRNISPSSVVLAKSPDSDVLVPKLTDFGSVAEGTSADCVNSDPLFTSPKIIAIGQTMTRSALGPDIQHIEYGESVDVWSTLAVFYFMLFGKPPFANLDWATDLTRLSKSSGKNLLFDSKVKISESCKDLLTEFLAIRDTPNQAEIVEDFGVESIWDQKLFDSVKDLVHSELMHSAFNLKNSIRVPGTFSKPEFTPKTSTEDMTEKIQTIFRNQLKKVEFTNETIKALEDLLEQADFTKEDTKKPEHMQLLEELVIFANLLNIVQKITIEDLSQDLELATGKTALKEIFVLIGEISPREIEEIFGSKWPNLKHSIKEEGKKLLNFVKNTKQSAWITKKYEQMIVDNLLTKEDRHLATNSHAQLTAKCKWYAAVCLKDLSDSNKSVRRVFKESCSPKRHFLLEAIYHAAVGLRFVAVPSAEEKVFGDQLRARIYNSKSWKDKLEELRKLPKDKKELSMQTLQRTVAKMRDPRKSSRCSSTVLISALVVLLLLLAAVWFAIKQGMLPALQRKFISTHQA